MKESDIIGIIIATIVMTSCLFVIDIMLSKPKILDCEVLHLDINATAPPLNKANVEYCRIIIYDKNESVKNEKR